MKTIQINKGDVISIDGYEFTASAHDTLTIEGEKHPCNQDYDRYYDYNVKCNAVDPALIEGQGYRNSMHTSSTGEFCLNVRTSTDIGGHYIAVNDEIVAFLANGFGDGNYTLRFFTGQHVR